MTGGWTGLRSPITGEALGPDGAHALREPGGRRWPVVDGIPYLRTGREALAEAALARLDAGDRAGALAVLLADQDDWWTGPPADPADLARLVAEADRLSLRDAMGLLGFGRVGDYFAHRWSDPTFIAGLALIEAHRADRTRSAFELACGIGHYGREFLRRGATYAGADVVFAKLWLARHWVVGREARLACFDAAAPWPVTPPLAEGGFDLVLCQDAFYFLEPKAEILERLRGLVAPDGRLLVGHVHNREAENYSAGRAATAEDLAGLFPGAVAYDDAELTRALVEERKPEPRLLAELRRVEAFALASGGEPRRLSGGYAVPPDAAALRTNPLYVDGAVRFPSERYAAEYGPLATYPAALVEPADALARAAAVRCRALVDLPERW
ncbi:class I SAM-dependent methyltransferase [Lichenibacterium dinghuense]|uniref:class I SAM-dependent methyltransferase n=1 Tax=Lichenibacterium dinghuense TaxID=2895977 RepID=UPI001F3376AF|nr:methyltransferase domain-containing protein [Lichenibacterium sp. 6Y81]